MQQLSTKDWGVISKANYKRVAAASTVFATVDAMSTLSGLFASSEVLFVVAPTVIDTAVDRMCYVRAKTARFSTCGRRRKRTLKMRTLSSSDSIQICGS